jgi:hypothetical protein
VTLGTKSRGDATDDNYYRQCEKASESHLVASMYRDRVRPDSSAKASRSRQNPIASNVTLCVTYGAVCFERYVDNALILLVGAQGLEPWTR